MTQKSPMKRPSIKEEARRFGSGFIGIFRAIPRWMYIIVFPFLIGVGITLVFCNADAVDQQGMLPPQSQFIEKLSHHFAYDGRTRCPSWVMNSLNSEEADQATNLSKLKYTDYTSDPDIPPIIQPDVKDYQNSGFDIVPLGVNIIGGKYSLALCTPQEPQLHRIYWTKLDEYAKTIIKKLNLFYLMVASGPLYLPQTEADGKKYVTYQVIGEDNIAVPTHLFKVLFYPVTLGGQEGLGAPWTVSSEAYILPNKFIDENAPLESFRVSLEELEKMSGVIFPKDMKPYFINRTPLPFP